MRLLPLNREDGGALYSHHRLRPKQWSREMSSKTDSPPSYEDALQHPKSNNYPFQTQHGAPLPRPPSYSSSPGACLSPPSYWSQGGVYPQAGMCPGPGFSSSVMPIPTLSAGLPASSPGEMDDFFSNQWESTSIRHAFIRKCCVLFRVLHSHLLQRAKEAFSIECGAVGSIYHCLIFYGWISFKLLSNQSSDYRHGNNSNSVHSCDSLLLPDEGGLHLLWGSSLHCSCFAHDHRNCYSHRALL
ncbi:hypothetical protein AMECASPLE_026331 [Ameca splendens]|uniref:Uncharacterized protein n=1 Tax=Ameca splendens TaxID=208324 RepID=A0ABV0YT19_9TELE